MKCLNIQQVALPIALKPNLNSAHFSNLKIQYCIQYNFSNSLMHAT